MSNDSAIVVAPAAALSMVMTPSEAEQRLRQLQDFVKRNMVQGVDYGVIPGTPKPSLLQPGAQKLAEIYGFATDFTDSRPPIEDWGSPGFFAYFKRCVVTRRADGLFMGAGVGSCNSGEKKYRKSAALDVVNTIEKMACKRALVMAMISVTRSSGIFTQDMEDMPAEQRRGREDVDDAEFEETAPVPDDALIAESLATAITAGLAATSKPDRKRILDGLIEWCRKSGVPSDKAAKVRADWIAKMANAKAAQPQPAPEATGFPSSTMTDEERLRAIDEARA